MKTFKTLAKHASYKCSQYISRKEQGWNNIYIILTVLLLYNSGILYRYIISCINMSVMLL